MLGPSTSRHVDQVRQQRVQCMEPYAVYGVHLEANITTFLETGLQGSQKCNDYHVELGGDF